MTLLEQAAADLDHAERQVADLERQLQEKDAEITNLTMRLREIEAMSRQGESE